MVQMAGMPIYTKHTNDLQSLCKNDTGLTMTYFTASSNLVTYRFCMGKTVTK